MSAAGWAVRPTVLKALAQLVGILENAVDDEQRAAAPLRGWRWRRTLVARRLAELHPGDACLPQVDNAMAAVRAAWEGWVRGH